MTAPKIGYTVELPLANTIFSNGQRSTLLAQRWTDVRTPDAKSQWIRSKQIHLPKQSLILTQITDNAQNTLRPHQPYYPVLTAPRKIISCMGNIIQSLERDGNSGQTMPASEELEKAISGDPFQRFVQDPAMEFEIWAQVVPKELWPDVPRPNTKTPLEALCSGYRMHRVLSGGGGWGAKRGLISLDPESRFGNHQPDDDIEESETEFDSPLPEVVRRGDVITFYAYTYRRDEGLVFPRSWSTQPVEMQTPSSYHFGSLRPNSDVVAAGDVGDADPFQTPEYVSVHGHFGALSETGMSVKLDLLGQAGTTYFGAQKLGTMVQTKLPFQSSFFYRPTVDEGPKTVEN